MGMQALAGLLQTIVLHASQQKDMGCAGAQSIQQRSASCANSSLTPKLMLQLQTLMYKQTWT
jgi:hypothetical protein